MGRGKIEIKRIESSNSRQVTFSKRRSGLLKKASELSILCDAEVAVIIFSSTGRLFEFSSTRMKQTLSRYRKFKRPPEPNVEELEEELKAEEQDSKEVDILKDEIVKLRSEHSQLLGKGLSGAGLKELQQLEQQLNEGLLSVRGRKEQLLKEQLERSKLQEQQAMLENQALRRQVAELRGLCQSTEQPLLPYLPPHSLQSDDSLAKQDAISPNMVNSSVEKEDIILSLGSPEMRKPPKRENRSSNTRIEFSLL